MKRIVASIFLSLFLAGCGVLGQVKDKITADVQSVARPDVESALAAAKAAGDADGAACWQDWLDYVNALPAASTGPQLPTGFGVASGLELARILSAQQIQVIPPIPAQLHKDCAVVLVDANVIAAKLGLTAASLKSGVGVIKAGAALQGQAAALKAAEAAAGVRP